MPRHFPADCSGVGEADSTTWCRPGDLEEGCVGVGVGEWGIDLARASSGSGDTNGRYDPFTDKVTLPQFGDHCTETT